MDKILERARGLENEYQRRTYPFLHISLYTCSEGERGAANSISEDAERRGELPRLTFYSGPPISREEIKGRFREVLEYRQGKMAVFGNYTILG